jgi:MoaA/NifB/PqqE/SkfB family radical SAM enzyme
MIHNELKLQRIVMEVFGGCNYKCKMCPQVNPGRDRSFVKKMPLDIFEKILDQIVPKYGTPAINLEGSGEPTLVKNLPEYVKAVKKRGLTCLMFSNGFNLESEFMQGVIDAGIDVLRISMIGYNREKYLEWMGVDHFDKVYANLVETRDYIRKSVSNCNLMTYHLITDNDNIGGEVAQYRQNIIDSIGLQAFIWKMHNWSGNYDNPNPRTMQEKRSCGRPFAQELTVRAGGEDGRFGAVTPCCQTLGPPNEIKSILGHFDTQSFEEIYFGEKYEELRKAHYRKDFESIEYCRNCDFLDGDPEVLVWSNAPNAKVNHMLGTDDEFVLTECIE